MPNKGRDRGRNYTREELDEVGSLLRKGFSYEEIAARKGYKTRSLMTTMSQHRKGARKGVFEDKKQETEDWIALWEIGVRMVDIAQKYGIRLTTLEMRFWRAGFDREVRQELKT